MSSKQISGFASLQPAYVFKLNIAQGHHVGTISSGSSFVHYDTPTGTIETVAGFEPRLQAEIVKGGDWLYFDPDKQHARLNIKGIAKFVRLDVRKLTISGVYLLKTAQGLALGFAITGVFTASDDIGAIFGGSPSAKTISFGLSTFTQTFETGEGMHRELENSTWVANGRFVVGAGGITLETRVSKVIPSTDMD